MPLMIRCACLVVFFAALAMTALLPQQAQALTLFGDDEARKAIIELRQRVQSNQQAAEAARLASEAAAQEARESSAASRRSLLELSGQIEQLRAELAQLRGQQEQLAREVSELQRQQKDVQSGLDERLRQQKDVQAGLDERLRQVEPLRITHEGESFMVAAGERRDFDAAMELLRRSEFGPAAAAYAAFLRRHPDSGYTASVLYWLGNAQYALSDYKAALETHRRLVTQFPAHLRTPEGMLAMANSHLGLKDHRSARRTLDELVKAHPQSEAAAAGRERLARLR